MKIDVFCTLARVRFINPKNNPVGKNVQEFLKNQSEHGFTVFKPQKPKRFRSKKRLGTDGKGKVYYKVKPADVEHRVTIPPKRPTCLQQFKKWFYDRKTGEAVIQAHGHEHIRIYDLMDMFTFEEEDMLVLKQNKINYGAGDDLKEEVCLFEKDVTKALEWMNDWNKYFNDTNDLEENARAAAPSQSHATT